MVKALLVALFAVAFPVAASAHHLCARLPHARVAAAAPSYGFPRIPIVTPAVNGASRIAALFTRKTKTQRLLMSNF